MSTPPTRSPGPGGTTSALPSLHENTTPRISSPLNPSPKPLPPPLPPPYQHTRAHAQTSSTEFPRVRRTSAASLAAQTQGHSPNGSPVWNMNGALSPPRQRFASSPATRQRTDSSPGSVTATRQRIGSSPCSPPHAQVETEATSFEALPVLEGFPRFRQGIQGHTYAHAHAQGYGNANAVGTGHSKGHGTQGIPIPSSSPLASSPFVGQSQLPSSSPVVGQSQVSSSPLWGQSQLSSSPFAGQIPLSGSSQGESRGNSPASVHSSFSNLFTTQ
ncbi:hypothetical protein BS17DRAFT_521945 [Gyrodon lividus]|nr:hypothetical protein BS17DRAFT_521945 [Gyrodon lividus]